jgi:uncharacterized protein (TIGR00269 family)
MACKLCKTKPVIKLKNSNVELCRSCFIRYFEKKVRKTIRNYNLISKNDKLMVACSGGKDSTVVLYLLRKIIKDRSVKIEVFHVNTDLRGYSKKNEENLIKFCEENNIKLYRTSFREEFGHSACYLKGILKSKGVSLKSCAVCGILRRYILNREARRLKATKLVTGHNLDDEAQSIMMNFFKNNAELFPRLGPITGVVRHKKFIPRIKPLYFCAEEEVKLYSKLKKFNVIYDACPCSFDSYRNSIKKLLNDLEKQYPDVKYSIISSFMKILPVLREGLKIKKVKVCDNCGEPCAGNECKVCSLLKKIKR